MPSRSFWTASTAWASPIGPFGRAGERSWTGSSGKTPALPFSWTAKPCFPPSFACLTAPWSPPAYPPCSAGRGAPPCSPPRAAWGRPPPCSGASSSSQKPTPPPSPPSFTYPSTAGRTENPPISTAVSWKTSVLKPNNTTPPGTPWTPFWKSPWRSAPENSGPF